MTSSPDPRLTPERSALLRLVEQWREKAGRAKAVQCARMEDECSFEGEADALERCADELSALLAVGGQPPEETNDVLTRSAGPDVHPSDVHAATDTKGL